MGIEKRKILQIIPADGWAAVYQIEKNKELVPLVCWALVREEEGTEHVVGMVVEDGNLIAEAADAENFSHYKPLRNVE